MVDSFRPEILIFQMGNYEYLPKIELKPYWKAVLTGKKVVFPKKKKKVEGSPSNPNGGESESESAPQTGNKLNPDNIYEGKIENYKPYSFETGLNLLFKNPKKYISWLLTVIDGYKRMPETQYKEGFKHLQSLLSPFTDTKTIYLSPFPLCVAESNRYRRRGYFSIKSALEGTPAKVADIWKPIVKSGNEIPEKTFFIDMAHLNKKGHEAIGNYLIEVLESEYKILP
jgi:hypothetical protein